jgi:hypothetical protein
MGAKDVPRELKLAAVYATSAAPACAVPVVWWSSVGGNEQVVRVYGHLLPGADREAARRLGELVKRRAQ